MQLAVGQRWLSSTGSFFQIVCCCLLFLGLQLSFLSLIHSESYKTRPHRNGVHSSKGCRASSAPLGNWIFSSGDVCYAGSTKRLGECGRLVGGIEVRGRIPIRKTSAWDFLLQTHHFFHFKILVQCNLRYGNDCSYAELMLFNTVKKGNEDSSVWG